MNLGEKLQLILDEMSDDDLLIAFYKEGDHDSIHHFIHLSDVRNNVRTYLSDFKEQGLIGYAEPDGTWVEYVDFRLIKEEN